MEEKKGSRVKRWRERERRGQEKNKEKAQRVGLTAEVKGRRKKGRMTVFVY